jgi:hypothetical protein
MIINPFILKPVYDADAQAFITAAGLTDFTSINAINTLVIGLKSASLWTKINAIYPMVGGTATSHKFNLKNTADTDPAFRLFFSGGWVHSSNGAAPNGANTYARTYFTPTVHASTSQIAMGVYSRTQDISGSRAWGALNSTLGLYTSHSFNGSNFIVGSLASQIVYSNTIGTKFHMARRTSTSFIEAYRDGASVGTNTATITALPAFEMYLGARNQNGTAGTYTTQQIAFAFLAGLGSFTNADAISLTTLVNNFQSTLGRAV